MTTTEFLTRPDGRIGYDVAGTGPLVVLVPGMGDLRATYRFLAPALREAGFRVAATDLRGHGDSDTTFASYGDAETATDVAALIEALDSGPAIIVGNSMAAGAAVIVAAQHPDLVSGLALVGPFVRNGDTSKFALAMFRLLMAKPWVATMWKLYLPKLYAGQRPSDFDAYLGQVIAAIRRPGHAKAFSLTTRLDHAPAEACLSSGQSPDTRDHGRTRSRLPEAEGRGRLDRHRTARRGRDGARGRALPAVATRRHHDTRDHRVRPEDHA